MNISEVLRDGIWQFVGVGLAFAAIGVSFLIFHLQRERKELSVGIISSRRLTSISQQIHERIVVTFDGTPVSNVWLTIIGIKNSGNRPILAADFERALVLSFPPADNLLSFEVEKQNPEGLAVEALKDGSQVTVMPLLLNPGDYFVAKVLLSTGGPKMSCFARIAGVSQISQINSGYRFGPAHRRGFRENFIAFGLMVSAAAVWCLISGKTELGAAAIFAMAALIMTITACQWLYSRLLSGDRRYIDDV